MRFKQQKAKSPDLFTEEIPDEPYLNIERRLWRSGFLSLAGCDEAGRGPLAGPVVAAACILPTKERLEYIQDSKVLTAERREEAFLNITNNPNCFWAVHAVSPEEIDSINILRATLLAMHQAINKLRVTCALDFVLIDGRDTPPLDVPCQAIVKGDSLSQSIAAASIIAKVTRDRMMIEYDAHYPEYGFKKHMGYGTEYHIKAIRQHGLTPIHRKTFCRQFTVKRALEI